MKLSSAVRMYYYLKKLQRTQWYSRTELERLQEKYLKAIIKYAYYNIPFYHKKFKEAGIKPDDIKCTKDLKKSSDNHKGRNKN